MSGRIQARHFDKPFFFLECFRGIPNSLPWKGELLAEIEGKKAKKEEELAKKKQEATKSFKTSLRRYLSSGQREEPAGPPAAAERLRGDMLVASPNTSLKEMHKSKESERRQKRAEEVLMAQLEALQRLLQCLGGSSLDLWSRGRLISWCRR